MHTLTKSLSLSLRVRLEFEISLILSDQYQMKYLCSLTKTDTARVSDKMLVNAKTAGDNQLQVINHQNISLFFISLLFIYQNVNSLKIQKVRD